jgi:hypothetical protein
VSFYLCLHPCLCIESLYIPRREREREREREEEEEEEAAEKVGG